jgi:hypothetical protein
MLQTEESYDLKVTRRGHSRQWTIETAFNEYYVNRYICLLEEQEAQLLEPNLTPTDEHIQLLIFSLWNVETGVSARLLGDEEKSNLLEVFGWLPVHIQLRRGTCDEPIRECPLVVANLTSHTALSARDLQSFWHFVNRLLRHAPHALYDPAKIGLLSLCEEAPRSEPHWQTFLQQIGFFSE